MGYLGQYIGQYVGQYLGQVSSAPVAGVPAPILVNEPLSYAREIAFNLPLDTNPIEGLEGHVFVSGEVQLSLPNSSWYDVDVSQIVEKGYGRYAIRLLDSQVTNAGLAHVRVDVVGAQPYFGYETIGDIASGQLTQSVAGYVPFYLPDAVNPVYGTPLSASFASLPGAVIRVCLPDSTYQDVDPINVLSVGNGGYLLYLTGAQTAKRGKVYIYATADNAQRFESYFNIVGVVAAISPTLPGPTPVPVPITPEDDEYVNQVALGLNRLPEQFRSGTVSYGVANEVGQSLSEFLGPFVPNVTGDFDVNVTVVDVTATNHLQQALNRLPVQFRSGALAYDAPQTTTTEEVVGTFTPSAPPTPYEIVVPEVQANVASHVATALNRLPMQFRSQE